MNNRKIKMYMVIYEHLLLLRQPIIEYLSLALPSIYKEDWWEKSIITTFTSDKKDNVKQNFEKDNKRRELEKNNIKTLDYFDFSDLLDILIHNWNCISIDEKKKKILFKLKNVRNDISHPNDNNLSSRNFKTYISYILEFSNIFNADDFFTKKLGKYISFEINTPQNKISDEEKRTKLLELVENIVLEPALNCNELNDDIKESLTRTLIRFEIAETIDDMYSFFTGALRSTRGEEIYNELTKYQLKTFENIRESFNNIYYS